MEFAVTMVIDVLLSRLVGHAPHFGNIFIVSARESRTNLVSKFRSSTRETYPPSLVRQHRQSLHTILGKHRQAIHADLFGTLKTKEVCTLDEVLDLAAVELDLG
jgi:hypothetical protein